MAELGRTQSRLADCVSVLCLGAPIFSHAWAFPGSHLPSNTESDLDTNVVRALKQSRKAGLRPVMSSSQPALKPTLQNGPQRSEAALVRRGIPTLLQALHPLVGSRMSAENGKEIGRAAGARFFLLAFHGLEKINHSSGVNPGADQ